jgi:hypothetical protein
MKSCVDCKFYKSAPAGARWDRCKHPSANVPTMTSTANSAGTDKCVHVRRFMGVCGMTASLFEVRTEGQWYIAASANLPLD